MVSFRNSQFQAILQGLVIADAMSWGQLPWPPLSSSPIKPHHPQMSAARMVDDVWCLAIAAQLQQLSSQPNRALSTLVPPVDHTATLMTLLVSLPQLLCQLDRQPTSSVCLTPPQSAADLPDLAVFATCLHACLNQNIDALKTVQQHLTQVPNPTATCLQQAIAIVLAARGDFQLAVGQSLHMPTAAEGLPVLTGILSAGWGALLSLPCRYQQSFQQPHSAWQLWLRERWQLSDQAQLSAWAEGLWQHWLGGTFGSQSEATMVAVLPA